MEIKDAESYEKAESISIHNIKAIQQNSRKLFVIYKKWSKLGDNRSLFKKLWGQQKFCWTGEFRFWVWVHELPDCQLIVMTAAEKGTCYEYVLTGEMKKATKQIIEFLKGIKNKEE